MNDLKSLKDLEEIMNDKSISIDIKSIVEYYLEFSDFYDILPNEQEIVIKDIKNIIVNL